MLILIFLKLIENLGSSSFYLDLTKISLKLGFLLSFVYQVKASPAYLLTFSAGEDIKKEFI
tara:strand:- start:343 stop:525 length:183 start_codon:yes stop_codon:yes gene_type:complete